MELEKNLTEKQKAEARRQAGEFLQHGKTAQPAKKGIGDLVKDFLGKWKRPQGRYFPRLSEWGALHLS